MDQFRFDSDDSGSEGEGPPARPMSVPNSPGFLTPSEQSNPLPLLVRKLAVFRKGLVRERGLRIDSETKVAELNEQLLDCVSRLREKEQREVDLFKKCEELSTQIKEQQEMRSNEQKLEKIFSSFGSKKSVEGENKLLKKEIIALKRLRESAAARIEELETALSKLQTQNLRNVENARGRIETLETNLKEKENITAQCKVQYENLKGEVGALKRGKSALEKERAELVSQREEAFAAANRERRRGYEVSLQLKRLGEKHQALIEKVKESREQAGDTVAAEGSEDGAPGADEEGGDGEESQGGDGEESQGDDGGDASPGKGGDGPGRPAPSVSLEDWQANAESEDSVIGYDALVREFNVFKLRDFFPKRPSKITIKKNLTTGQITILVERAGVTRIHPATSVKGAYFGGKAPVSSEARGAGRASSLGNGTTDITFHIKYYNQKVDYFESHRRQEICAALNRALKPASSAEATVDASVASYHASPNSPGGAYLHSSPRKNESRSASVPYREARLCSPLTGGTDDSGGRRALRGQSISSARRTARRSSSTQEIRDELQDFFGL